MPAGRKPSPPSRADELADIVLPDHECHDVRLGDLWSDRPVALVWLRHYGCPYRNYLSLPAVQLKATPKGSQPKRAEAL